jgi:hypothetical protein
MAGASVGEAETDEDSGDGITGRQWTDSHGFHLLEYGIGPVWSAPIIEIEPRGCDDLLDFALTEGCAAGHRYYCWHFVIPGWQRYRYLSHPERVCFLSFEVFDLQDDICGYGSFLVKHGVGESGLGDGADFSGDAERELVDCIQGVLIEDRLRCSCEF